MQQVIGGEFTIPHSMMEHTHEVTTTMFASGRSALRGIVRAIRKNHLIETMCVPNYICDSVTQALQREQVPYNFYEVGLDMYPKELPVGDVVLLVNYFGMIDVRAWVARIKSADPNTIVIVDNVQNYYGEDVPEADYLFNSLRKWFPLPDGAEVVSHANSVQCPLPEEENHFVGYKIAGNLLKNYTSDVPESIALQLLESGEERIDSADSIIGASVFSIANRDRLDYQQIRKQRQENAAYIHTRLQELNIQHIWNQGATPLFVPVLLAHHRDEVRRKMFAQQIFTPIHWPWIGNAINGVNDLYKMELSLICDQRYDIEDMTRQMEIFENACRDYGLLG